MAVVVFVLGLGLFAVGILRVSALAVNNGIAVIGGAALAVLGVAWWWMLGGYRR